MGISTINMWWSTASFMVCLWTIDYLTKTEVGLWAFPIMLIPASYIAYYACSLDIKGRNDDGN